MKKKIHSILVLAFALFISVNFRYYSTFGRVIGYDYPSDTLYIETVDENIWEYGGVEDWQYDDLCSVVFCDNGTDAIEDDEIVYMRYIGYIVCEHNF